jgi:hypothetical protein
MATIELRRLDGFVDALRSWVVVIDGEKRGKIKRNSVERFSVDPGVHKIQLKIAWCGSNIIELDTSHHEQISLICCPKQTPRTFLLGNLLWPAATAEMLFAPNQRIVLEKVD